MGTGAAVAIGLVAVGLLRLDETPKAAPDSAYYLTQPYDVPKPFAYRPLLPLLARKHLGVWVALTYIGIVLQAIGMYWIAGTVVAPLLLLGLPGGARISVRHPVLVDAFALGAVLVVAGAGAPLWVLGLLVPVLGLMREQAPILLAILTGQPWLVAGILAPLVAGEIFGRPADLRRDNAFIVHPWRTVATYRRGHWLSLRHMALPWGAVLPLAMLVQPWPWPALLALAVALLPALRASDAGRVLMWGAPVVILVAVQAPIAPTLWPLVILAHWLNPYRGG